MGQRLANVGKIVRATKEIMMNVRACLSLSAAVLSLFAGAAAVAQTQYTGVVLQPSRFGFMEIPGDINNSGAIVGSVHSGAPFSTYMRNSNGVWTDLGVGGGTYSNAPKVNESGQVVWTMELNSGG